MAGRVTPTVCTICEAGCGLLVETDGERVVTIRGDRDDPFSEGHICPKAYALADVHHDPDRLRRPLHRHDNGFVEVSWDEALDWAADHLSTILSRYGKQAIGVYGGNPIAHNLGLMLGVGPFLKALRTPNVFTATSVDHLPHLFVARKMFGHALLLPVPDLDRTHTLLIVGANPLVSNGSLMTAPGVKRRLAAIRSRGGAILVVDPVRTETAKHADEHFFIRPGTDAFFLLGIVRELLQRGVSIGRLADRCENLDVLEEIVGPFNPAVVQEVTSVGNEALDRIATALIKAPRAVAYGRVGLSLQPFGALSIWGLTLINILTGNLDRPGGAMFTKPAVDLIEGPPGVRASSGRSGRWKSRVRGVREFNGELPAACMAEEILEPGADRLRAMVVIAGNPVLTTPNGRQLDDALDSLDFMVSIDPYLNETSRHANLILPPCSPLERPHYDFALAGVSVRNRARYSPAVFPRAQGCYDDGEILGRLGAALLAKQHRRLPERFGFELRRRLSPERQLDAALRFGPYGGWMGQGLSLKRLLDHPRGIDLGLLQSCLPGRLPKGKIDLAPARLVGDLTRAFEAMREPPPELVLIGRRTLRSHNSWLHNCQRLMRGDDRCTLMMHPDDATRLGLLEGQRVRVSSPQGAIEVPLTISDAILKGVVSLPHGFGHDRAGTHQKVASRSPGASLNDLTDDKRLDQACGTAALNAIAVEVRAASVPAHEDDRDRARP